MHTKVLVKYRKRLKFREKRHTRISKSRIVFSKVKYVPRQYKKLNSLYWRENLIPKFQSHICYLSCRT